ncbi:MAG: fibronectin type III domain-containing protein, partial [Candidatus Thermoplasmatota archaeon]|nr:fibronectin type III domain-containing protein [Candidatus Thermoplasmatota archaeon]
SRLSPGIVISGLSASTTYYFTVRVVDTGLLYSDSNQVPGTTLPPNLPPTAVLLSTPTEVTNNSLRLTWSENSDSDFATYDILVSTSPGAPGPSVARLTAANKISYIVTGLYQNTNYYFTIRVTDVGGLLADSNQETAKTLPNDNPPIPVLLSDPLNVADYSLTLRWSGNADPDFARYDIYRSNDSAQLGILVVSITVQSVTEHVLVDLQPKTTYYFVVRVVDAGLQAADSNQVTGTTLSAAASVENDTDNDGLPDHWERQHFNDLTEGALGDPDDDGLPNIVEYHDGTDPTVPDERAEPGVLDEYLWIIMLILALVFLIGMLYASSGKKRLKKQVSREKSARRALVTKHKRELKRLQPLLIPEMEAEAPPPPPEAVASPPEEVEKAPPKKVTPKKKVKPKAKKVAVRPKKRVPPPPKD